MRSSTTTTNVRSFAMKVRPALNSPFHGRRQGIRDRRQGDLLNDITAFRVVIFISRTEFLSLAG